MRLLILILLLVLSPLIGNEIALKNKLYEATDGSYIVTEQDKTYTLLHIYEKKGNLLILEEVSIPATRYPKGISFREWFESGAPGHTAWLMSQINLQSGKVEESFSFPHQGWIDLSQSDSFLSTLLNLRFQEVEISDRRRIGLPPGYNKPDHRPLWNPRLVFEGQVVSNVSFTAWKARWPSDCSELARKNIEVYLPDSASGFHYPTYFPYWLEVEGKIGSAKVRVVDSGLDARSPKPPLPLRQPSISSVHLNQDGLYITLKAPSYYSNFMILAEEQDCFLAQAMTLPCQTLANGDQVVLFSPRKDLESCMKTGSCYHFLISPEETPSVCLETEKPLIFR